MIAAALMTKSFVLELRGIGAKNVRAADETSASDPYVVVTLLECDDIKPAPRDQTPPKRNESNPEWPAPCILKCPAGSRAAVSLAWLSVEPSMRPLVARYLSEDERKTATKAPVLGLEIFDFDPGEKSTPARRASKPEPPECKCSCIIHFVSSSASPSAELAHHHVPTHSVHAFRSRRVCVRVVCTGGVHPCAAAEGYDDLIGSGRVELDSQLSNFLAADVSNGSVTLSGSVEQVALPSVEQQQDMKTHQQMAHELVLRARAHEWRARDAQGKLALDGSMSAPARLREGAEESSWLSWLSGGDAGGGTGGSGGGRGGGGSARAAEDRGNGGGSPARSPSPSSIAAASASPLELLPSGQVGPNKRHESPLASFAEAEDVFLEAVRRDYIEHRRMQGMVRNPCNSSLSLRLSVRVCVSLLSSLSALAVASLTLAHTSSLHLTLCHFFIVSSVPSLSPHSHPTPPPL